MREFILLNYNVTAVLYDANVSNNKATLERRLSGRNRARA